MEIPRLQPHKLQSCPENVKSPWITLSKKTLLQSPDPLKDLTAEQCSKKIFFYKITF